VKSDQEVDQMVVAQADDESAFAGAKQDLAANTGPKR